MTRELSSHVLKSASVIDTAFYAHFDGLFGRPRHPKRYRHGQHFASRTDGTYGQSSLENGVPWDDDDHQSPVPPEQYIELRVRPQIEFYQSRLPHYSRQRGAFETAMLLASIAGLLLAFLDGGAYTGYAACASAATAAVTAYSKFSAPAKKLQRYSDAIAGVRTTLMWWGSLTEVEQAGVQCISELVLTCEELFSSERQAWVSTAMANTKMNAEGGGDEEEGEAGGKRSRVAPE